MFQVATADVESSRDHPGTERATMFAKDQLKAIVERVERLEEERKTISDDIRDVYAEAKGNGYDVKALRTIVRLRKQDAGGRARGSGDDSGNVHASAGDAVMISLSELDDCKTCEQLIDLIHLDAEADDWDFDDLEDDEDDEEPWSAPQSRADSDACAALIREALEYAALGDLAEAKLRVRNRFHPKFDSLRECKALYDDAMSERQSR